MYETDEAASGGEHPAFGETAEYFEQETFELDEGEYEMDSHEAGSTDEAGESEEAELEGEFGVAAEAEFPGEVALTQEFGLQGESDVSEEEEVPQIHETAEIQLASELLEVTNEAELDRFLGKLIRRASRTVKKGVSAATGNSLGGVLKGLAKKALPMLGTAIGGPFGAIAANAAGNALGLEFEGLSGEDREYETARGFVRFADNAAKRALSAAARGDPSPVRAALSSAARRYAPGLLTATSAGGACGCGTRGLGRGGVWFRRGSTIVLQPHGVS